MIDWIKLHQILDKWKSAWSWREVGKELGIPSSTFTRMKKGKPANADYFARICWATGTDVLQVFDSKSRRGDK